MLGAVSWAASLVLAAVFTLAGVAKLADRVGTASYRRGRFDVTLPLSTAAEAVRVRVSAGARTHTVVAKVRRR